MHSRRCKKAYGGLFIAEKETGFPRLLGSEGFNNKNLQRPIEKKDEGVFVLFVRGSRPTRNSRRERAPPFPLKLGKKYPFFLDFLLTHPSPRSPTACSSEVVDSEEGSGKKTDMSLVAGLMADLRHSDDAKLVCLSFSRKETGFLVQKISKAQ